MTPISVVIITFNEERNIERCLRSVFDVADEIVVLDSLSTDRTREICREFDVKFIEQPFLGYIEQKNKALEFATYPHVLSLDADEALSDELKKTILEIKNNWCHDCYCFNRLTNFCGTWVRHCGWYPDRKLRLFNKHQGKWGGNNPHDRFILNDNSAPHHIKGDLLHYSYYSIEQHVAQINKFSTIKAENDFRKNKKAALYKVLLAPLFKFIIMFFLKAGFLDGFHGFVICMNSAHSHFLKFIKLRQLVMRQHGEH